MSAQITEDNLVNISDFDFDKKIVLMEQLLLFASKIQGVRLNHKDLWKRNLSEVLGNKRCIFTEKNEELYGVKLGVDLSGNQVDPSIFDSYNHNPEEIRFANIVQQVRSIKNTSGLSMVSPPSSSVEGKNKSESTGIALKKSQPHEEQIEVTNDQINENIHWLEQQCDFLFKTIYKGKVTSKTADRMQTRVVYETILNLLKKSLTSEFSLKNTIIHHKICMVMSYINAYCVWDLMDVKIRQLSQCENLSQFEDLDIKQKQAIYDKLIKNILNDSNHTAEYKKLAIDYLQVRMQATMSNPDMIISFQDFSSEQTYPNVGSSSAASSSAARGGLYFSYPVASALPGGQPRAGLPPLSQPTGSLPEHLTDGMPTVTPPSQSGQSSGRTRIRRVPPRDPGRTFSKGDQKNF